ncbi:MAG: cation:proton antiporter [Clostridia bacterium]|nr:cation:proton antiporter [Clostridia bacterium]
MKILLLTAITILAGLLMSRAAKPLSLPAVTAYIVAGILVGPFCLGQLGIPGVGFSSLEEVEGFTLISKVATGFIAFSIGNEFRLSALKKTGKAAAVIGVFQALVATLFVDISLIIVHFIFPDVISLPVAITLGAVAAATAPAATLMVVNQYKAKGEVTSLLLPIVALDDAVGLVIFAVSFGVAKSLTFGAVDVVSVIVEPIAEVIASLALGFVMGFLFNFLEKFFHSRSKRMALSIAFVLLTVAITDLKFTVGGVSFGFSNLLACMMLGTVFCNLCEVSEELMDRVDRWTAPLYIMFFALSGAELDFVVFGNAVIILIGIVYIISRSAGKYLGARWFSKACGCSHNVQKYLGITLFPQAGVALGMSITAQQLGADGTLIRNIILFSVLIYELVGPLMTKTALTAAGEIVPEGKRSSRGIKDQNSRRA